MAKPGIFCLEGEWTSNLTDRSSVREMVEILCRNDDINLIYRNVSSQAEYINYIKRWSEKQYDNYKIGYFSMHGEYGSFMFPREGKLEL